MPLATTSAGILGTQYTNPPTVSPNSQNESKLKAGVRAKVEHPFPVIKRQFGDIKVRYRGSKKNPQQLVVLFVLSNLWMVRGKLMKLQSVGGRPSRRIKACSFPKYAPSALNRWRHKYDIKMP